jgi:hypothetical protein
MSGTTISTSLRSEFSRGTDQHHKAFLLLRITQRWILTKYGSLDFGVLKLAP